MTDIHLGGAGIVFQPSTEFVTLAAGIGILKHPAQGIAQEALRHPDAVFSPIRLQDASLRGFGLNREARLLPELANHRPDLFGGLIHHQPALIASALNSGSIDIRQQAWLDHVTTRS